MPDNPELAKSPDLSPDIWKNLRFVWGGDKEGKSGALQSTAEGLLAAGGYPDCCVKNLKRAWRKEN